MQLILTGLLTGLLTFLAFVMLIEKMPPIMREFLYGHYLLTDVGFTVLSFLLLPVVGTSTLIATAFFCILFSLYLAVMRSVRPWRKVTLGGKRFIYIQKGAPHAS